MITITIMHTRIERGVEGVRLTLGALALAAVIAGSFQPYFLRIWKQDWGVLHAYLTELPYRKIPGLRQLLVETNRRTPDGARILFAMPGSIQKDGYDYAFGRAQYMLAGKDVVPRFAKDAGDVEYIVCWSRCNPPAHFAVIWKSDVGSLARRRP